MSIKAVLFDLDGTLLPMDQNEFIKHYFGGLSTKLATKGYDPKELLSAIWSGVSTMAKEPQKINEQSFWDRLCEIYGQRIKDELPTFEEFYENDFDKISAKCGHDERADGIVKMLKAKGIIVILATNPVFPAIATQKRMKWAGLDIADFDLVTTYENSKSIKPQPEYYNEILSKFGLKPEECIMVGNDIDEDMIAEKMGLKVFLMTDCLLNKDNKDISRYPSGSFDELKDFLNKNTYFLNIN